MKRLLLAALTLAPTFAFASSWDIDSGHSGASFAVKHLMVATVRGDLGKVSGTVELDDKDITKSTVNATIAVEGINTRDAKRDAHLKNDDFFNAAKYPNITFKSKKVEKGAGEGKLKVTGDLTIRDVTKEVVLDTEVSNEIKDPWGNTKRGVLGTTKINRKDFGLKWNAALEGGGLAVSEDVSITIDAELQKKVAAAAPAPAMKK